MTKLKIKIEPEPIDTNQLINQKRDIFNFVYSLRKMKEVSDVQFLDNYLKEQLRELSKEIEALQWGLTYFGD